MTDQDESTARTRFFVISLTRLIGGILVMLGMMVLTAVVWFVLYARRLPAMRKAGINCGLGTDVGGGTSLSMLRTASEAYKVLHLQEHALPAMRALYLATLGAAETLDLDDKIGNFKKGKEADFAVLDFAGSSLTARRSAAASTIEEKLFALMTLADDRNVAATYVEGRLV